MPPRKKPVKIEPMTKEAASIIKSMETKQFLDEIVKLKDELKRLDKKIIEREILLKSMGKEREAKLDRLKEELDNRESSIRALHLKVDKDKSEFDKEVTHFKNHEKIIMNSLKATDVQVTLAREEVELNRIEIATKDKDLKDRKSLLNKEKTSLRDLRVEMNVEANQIKERREKLEADKSKLWNDLHNLGIGEKALIDRKEALNLISEDLVKKLDKSNKLQIEVDKQLDKANKLKADVEIAHENNVQSSSDSAAKEKELEERERDLKISRQALGVERDKLQRKERDLRILQDKEK